MMCSDGVMVWCYDSDDGDGHGDDSGNSLRDDNDYGCNDKRDE